VTRHPKVTPEELHPGVVAIADIQACVAQAQHDCFGSRGSSGLAMPLPRQGQWRLAVAFARSDRLTRAAE